MRWKSDHSHDPRLIDLLAVFALIAVISAAWWFLEDRSDKPVSTSFIVPSQHVRW